MNLNHQTTQRGRARPNVELRMKNAEGIRFCILHSSFFLAWGLAIALTAGAQTTAQTFQLRAGWNSIWLEVQPTNTDLGALFTNLQVASVWTYVAQPAPVEFIQNQTEALFNQRGWLGYFPPSRPESFLTTLHAVQGLRAYLVRLTNAATLTVTGRPAIRPVEWVADSFNLRGFPVNPAQLPAFGAFFGQSAAHAGQRIYQLGTNGQWQLVAPSDRMKHGEAYWVFTRGASTYPGPSGMQFEIGDGLDFGSVLLELVPSFINNSTNDRTVTITDLTSGAGNPFSYLTFLSNRLTWVNLPSPHVVSVEAGQTVDLRMAIRRNDFAGTNYTALFEIKDDLGTRYLVPVSAEKLRSARLTLSAPKGASLVAGLWVGTVSVTNVNEVNSSQPEVGTPTRSPFDLRLLLHVTDTGQARLLKEVIQMWQDGTTTNNAQGRAVTDKPGRFVLLTRDTLVPQFRGAALRDGVPVGRRFSTVDFDFDGGTNNFLSMNGGFGVGHTTSCTLVLEPDFPTNPFKHKFHPDHDNLNATFTAYQEEAYRVTRQIELEFTSADPAGSPGTIAALEYGQTVLAGIYRETVSGLHRRNILATGTFRLTRVSNSPVLNQ